MTQHQKRWAEKMLALGCKGVTCINVGARPKYSNCYKSKVAAIAKQEKLNKTNPNCCAKVFSIHFWNDGKNGDNPEVTFSEKTGKADMSEWDESAKPGKNWIRFDYGFLNPDGTITHANHYYNPEDPNKKGKGKYYSNLKEHPITDTNDNNRTFIYISTLEEWKKSNDDFNDEVWCTQCIGGQSGITE